MTNVAKETARAQGYLAGRLYEQSKMREGADYSRPAGRSDEQSETLQELKAGQRQINARIDRLNERFDRIMLAGWIVGGVAIVTTQMGMLGTLIVFTIRLGSGS